MPKRNGAHFFFLLLLFPLVFMCSCREPKLSLSEGEREYLPSDYEQILRKWTRNKSLFSLQYTDDLLTVTSTFESWDFRWAYSVKYAEDYRLTFSQRHELLKKNLLEARKHHEFYVALYGAKWRWVDLSKPTSAWVVRLVDDGGHETSPAEIEAVRKPGPLELRYFPYTTPWRQVFRIRFPLQNSELKALSIPEHTKWISLRFAGPYGSEELRWELISEPEKKMASAGPDGVWPISQAEHFR